MTSPTVSRFGVPDLGIGVGFRVPHYREIVENQPAMDWFEVLSENFLVDGGSPLHWLRGLAAHYPAVPHGVGLSLGSRGDPEHLSRLSRLVNELDPPWVSDHLCFTGTARANTHDLLPLPYTDAARDHVVRRIGEVKRALGGRVFAVENVSSYLTYEASQTTEWDFLSQVVTAADCGLLLDVNNVFVSSVNHGFDPMTYLDGVPLDRVTQIHLAGHSTVQGSGGVYHLDTHDGPVCDEVWALYTEVIRRTGPVSTLIEWDGNIPAFSRLQEEAERAREVRASAVSAWSRDRATHAG